MWVVTTALMLSSTQMADAVAEWRLTVRTLNFLPKWDRVFRNDDRYQVDSDKRQAKFAHLTTTIARKFPNVETLVINDYWLTDSMLETLLSYTPRVRKLDLGHIQHKLTKHSIRIICTSVPHLEFLKLCSNQLDNTCMATLFDKYFNIKSLVLRSCWNVSNLGVQCVTKSSSSLREFQLVGSKVTDRGIQLLVDACTHLEVVDVSHSNKITDNTAQTIAKGCSELKLLKLNGCRQLTDATLAHVSTCSHLHTLEVSSCKNITDDGMTSIAQGRCDMLRHLSSQIGRSPPKRRLKLLPMFVAPLRSRFRCVTHVCTTRVRNKCLHTVLLTHPT
jgi:hypothetical protein